jgi:hypothetical protein
VNPSDVLSIAVVYLADFFVSFIDPDTAALLRERATTNQSGVVRQATAQALAASWRDDPDTAALLRERATTDQSGAVRQAAAHRWRPAGATTPTLPLLREQRRRNT